MDLSMKLPETANGFGPASSPTHSLSSHGGVSPGHGGVSPGHGEPLSDRSRPGSRGGTPGLETSRAADSRGHPFPISRLMGREPAEMSDKISPTAAPAAAPATATVTAAGCSTTPSSADRVTPVGE